MVSLVATRNVLLFSGALAAGVAAFWIALGRDEGTPMQLPVLPKIHASHAARAPEPAPPPAPYVPPPMPVTAAPAPAAPDPLVVQQLGKLVATARTRLDKLAPPHLDCTVLSTAEQKRIHELVAKWVDKRNPGEKDAPTDMDANGGRGETIGCAEPEGVLVTLAIDRMGKHDTEGYKAFRRNYVLRVNGDRIEVIAERTSSASMNWMEWSDEGGYRDVGMVDFDGDGKRDTIYLDDQHEGGDMHSHSTVMLRSANGTVSALGTVTDLPGIEISNGKVIIAAKDPHDRRTYWRCLAKDLALSTCPETDVWEQYSAKYDALERLEDSERWTREQVTADFATLGITGHADLVKMLPAEPVGDVVRDHVEQFLIATHQLDPADDLIERPHPEAQRFFDGLANQLGDKRCTPAKLTGDVSKRVTSWVKAHAKELNNVTVQADCGNYVWAGYETDAKALEILFVADGSTLSKVVTLPGVMQEGPGYSPFNHGGGFFMHGDKLVGSVFADNTLYAIANGKVIAKHAGQIAALDYASGEADFSFDLVSDGKAILHATPAGIETIDAEPLRPHQIHRAALERVTGPYPVIDKDYVAALRTLGAPEALLAQVKLAL